jgi:hypothetical protein
MQKRYTQLSRFNVFLPPGTKYTLEGPDPSRLPVAIEGQYLILLRIEATDDKEGDSNLSVVGGRGVVHSGAVAGFPLPPLGYMVGSGTDANQGVKLLLPVENSVRSSSAPLDFSWTETPQATFYRIEIETAQGQAVLSALLPPGRGIYRAPPWLREKTADGNLRWRVVALDQSGNPASETAWRNLQLAMPR